MLIALVVMMAGVLLLTIVVNNRRRPSRWDRDDRRSGWDGGSAGDGQRGHSPATRVRTVGLTAAVGAATGAGAVVAATS